MVVVITPTRIRTAPGVDPKLGLRSQGKLTQCYSLDEVFQVVRNEVDQFDSINASTALHRIASKGTREFDVSSSSSVNGRGSSTSVA